MSQALYDKCRIWSVGGVYTYIQSCVPTPTQREFPVRKRMTLGSPSAGTSEKNESENQVNAALNMQ